MGAGLCGARKALWRYNYTVPEAETYRGSRFFYERSGRAERRIHGSRLFMTQGERWLAKYNEVKDFIEVNHRNPSKYDAEERGFYCNWLKHNRKLYNAGEMKGERMEMFKELMELGERYKHKNQYG